MTIRRNMVAVEDEEIAHGRRPHRRRARLIEEHGHLPEELPFAKHAEPRSVSTDRLELAATNDIHLVVERPAQSANNSMVARWPGAAASGPSQVTSGQSSDSAKAT